jgi:predicted  nucleic acid-binding Zn-ribbon protein
MLEVIEKLLVLQDRDQKLRALEFELGTLDPLRRQLQARTQAAQAALDAAKLKVKHLESDRKKLELESAAKRQLIEKYSVQQYQTKKNDEYRALTHEIDTCRQAIVRLEDQELDVMEQGESAQREVHAAVQGAETARSEAERATADLAERERALVQRQGELAGGRDALAAAIAPDLLGRYERLRRNKGDRVVVGVDHGACGGCHMKLPSQVVLACRADQEVVSCINCARILYYTREMDMVVAE